MRRRTLRADAVGMTAFGGRLVGTRRSIAGTVYGTIVVMSVIVAGSRRDQTSAGDLAAVTMTTAIVLWLAHVYASAMAESLQHGRPLSRGAVGGVAARQASIVLAAVGPVAVLAGGAVGVLTEATAVWIALALGTATLGVQGVRFARTERLGRAATALAVSLNVLLGLILVALKVAVMHY
jgi:hypothetical protein